MTQRIKQADILVTSGGASVTLDRKGWHSSSPDLEQALNRVFPIGEYFSPVYPDPIRLRIDNLPAGDFVIISLHYEVTPEAPEDRVY